MNGFRLMITAGNFFFGFKFILRFPVYNGIINERKGGAFIMKMKRTITRTVALITASLLFAVMILTGGNGVFSSAAAASGTPVYSSSDLFTDRDLKQTADMSDAATLSASDGGTIRITEAGTYVLTGTASDCTFYVEAGDDDKVQLVLQGLHITNSDFPCIYVYNADKVFITTAEDSSLTVNGTFRTDGSIRTDGAVFCRTDLVMNGTAVLTIQSTDNGVVCKDDLKITGGTYTVTANSKAFEANDSIRIMDGTFILRAGTDGLHAENSDDDSQGYIYIGGGELTITCGDDGLHATSVLQIDDGTLTITAAEGLEGSFIQVNGGTVNITASDDGINAARKSTSTEVAVEFNGGTVNVTMGGGDTDGVDSNGNLYVNGGVISVNGNSTFDYDGTVAFNGGTIYVNGQQTTTIPNQFFGGGRGGGWNSTPNGNNSQGGFGGGRRGR